MAMSHQVSQPTQFNGALLEKVIINQDLSCLQPEEKVQYMTHLCKSLGLNPVTKPFELIKFQGKEVPYARKDCTEQLRKLHHVSIRKLETKFIEGGIYVVIADAQLPDGRTDSATGVVSIQGLKGDALSNAFMKAETKAKRRVTLSICGLGMLDESEIESIPGSKKVFTNKETKEIVKDFMEVSNDAKKQLEESHDIEKDITDMTWCDSVDDLKETYTKAYKYWAKLKNKENLDRLIKAKDKRIEELEKENTIGETIDPETGEISSNEKK